MQLCPHHIVFDLVAERRIARMTPGSLASLFLGATMFLCLWESEGTELRCRPVWRWVSKRVEDLIKAVVRPLAVEYKVEYE
jgi:hypothetical protein